MPQTERLKQSTKLPYSYHTFLLAFYIDGGFSFKDADTGRWRSDSIRSGKDNTEKRLNYQNFQYYTPEARRLMFDVNESPVHRFIYDIDENADRSYIIRKTFEDDKTKVRTPVEYRLTIDNIRAIVFRNNIVILQFDLENHDPNHMDIESVKQINEYGRRINMPYIVDEGVVHSLVADSISIMGNSIEYSCFGNTALNRFLDGNDNMNIVPPILALIHELLPVDEKSSVKINPVIDDRMFVCCLVRDEAFSRELKSLIKKDDNSAPIIGSDIYTDRDISNKLYSFAFVDAKSSSCQSPEMRETILKRCIYSRWRDWGTVHIVTHHSLMCITGASEDIAASVINPFLTEYVTMASGVLLQRATLMRLSDRCSRISERYFSDKLDKKERKTIIEEIRNLKKDYVYSQNNIFLTQFTAQEQGIEVFDMMRNEMYIKDSLKNLNYKVNGIYDFITENAESEENDLLSTLTKIGLPLAFMQVLTVVLSFNFFSGKSSWGQAGALGAIVGLCSVSAGLVFLMLSSYHKSSKTQYKKSSKFVLWLLRALAIIGLIAVLVVSAALLAAYVFK
ncbi:MAG: hypothetical protein IJH07_05860 [Ruminococcus sp.]|nr:hypothetical protein [Ruminococcus sp.]